MGPRACSRLVELVGAKIRALECGAKANGLALGHGKAKFYREPTAFCVRVDTRVQADS